LRLWRWALLRQLLLQAIRLAKRPAGVAELVGGVAACVHEELLERGGLYAALVARDVADPV
jgi:hypothetical protein